VIVSQVLLDFVNAIARFALSNTKSNLTTCFSSMGITKKCHQEAYQWSETFPFAESAMGFYILRFCKRGSLDTQGEIRGGLLAR